MEEKNSVTSGQQPDSKKEGQKYKNVETGVDKPSSLDEGYESKTEDDLSEEEPRTEKGNDRGKMAAE